MIVFAREVIVCVCSTDVARSLPAVDLELGGFKEAGDSVVQRVQFRFGQERDLGSLDTAHHETAHLNELRERLLRGERWLLGVDGDRVVTYTWLHTRRSVAYPYLPGCEFEVAADVGYGYDAWTPPELRGVGLRRLAFVEELRVLGALGMRWEASFFVKHQLDGATRSLAKAGIAVEPLWLVRLRQDRTLAVERLADRDIVRPCFSY
jgi:hypothetical protein